MMEIMDKYQNRADSFAEKVPQIPQNLFGQFAQKFGISLKKGFIVRP